MLALAPLLLALAPAGEWRYVVPPEGHALRAPRLTALPLSDGPPDELELRVELTGAWQTFGMLRYGDPDSARVAVLLDHRSARDFDLYVDVGRDLAIDPEDRVEGPGPAFELSLAVMTRDAAGRDLFLPRRVRLELGRTGAVFGVATLGWLEGEVELDGRALSVLRRDGDANGFFGDARDQLWLDRDGDGDFQPLSELFVVQPILTLDGRRFTVRSDRLGSDLALAPLEGAGSVRLELRGPDGAARADVLELAALLVGRDGSAVLARAPGEPTEVPVGEYRLGMVTARLADPGGGREWSFVFSEAGRAEDASWREVAKGAELALDPVGELGFELRVHGELAPGAGLAAVLSLRTADGLRINTAYRGREAQPWGAGGLEAAVELVDGAGRVHAAARSGFA